ncbi:MAG: methyltransferase domain-containing protein [Thermomicrobiales bacterium]|nr:methyltransferase domain-containing protein [Thermomicrobiales bacterium]
MSKAPDATEWNATVYHRVSDPHQTWGARVLERLHARGDETAIDCGCGTGRLTAELLERLPAGRAIAIDRSLNMLNAAREFLTPRFGDRVTFRQADLQTFDLEELGEQVDLIFSTATFHWILDHPRLFANLFGILKPGGWLVAQCGGGPNLARLLERAHALQAESAYAPFFAGWPGPWEFSDDITAAERLRAAGFDEVATDLEYMPAVMSDAAAYREFLTNVIFGSHLARVPDPVLRERYVDRLTDLAAADETPFELDYWRLNLRARRPV